MNMKKRAILHLALLLACASPAQTVYKGQVRVSGEEFSIQGSMLHVRMRMSYGAGVVNRGETLVLKPVLKDGYRQYDLSSVVVTDRHHVSPDLRRGNLPVASRSVRRGTYFFDYDTTVPYGPWMQGASLYMESEERGRNGRTHVYEDLIIPSVEISQAEADGSAVLAAADGADPGPSASRKRGGDESPESNALPAKAPVGWVQFTDPSQPLHRTETVSGVIPLSDSRNIGSLSTRRFNALVEAELLDRLSGRLGRAGLHSASLRIVGYGAPTGSHRRNETRSALRAIDLKEHLSRQLPQCSDVTVSWVAEDWDSIASLVGRSGMRLGRAASDIIRQVPVSEGREQQLRQLDGGSVYAILRRDVFPRVCRLEYTATLRLDTPGAADDAAAPLRLQEMYAAAMRCEPSSAEFRDLMDLSARLFPQSVAARVNAAGAALLAGDAERAQYWLDGCADDPRAYCNQGVACLLRGDRTRAAVYLRMAQAAGSREAAGALAALRTAEP